MSTSRCPSDHPPCRKCVLHEGYVDRASADETNIALHNIKNKIQPVCRTAHCASSTKTWESFTQRSHSLIRTTIRLALFHSGHSSWHARSATCAARNLKQTFLLITSDMDVSILCLQNFRAYFEVFNIRAFAVRCLCERPTAWSCAYKDLHLRVVLAVLDCRTVEISGFRHSG